MNSLTRTESTRKAELVAKLEAARERLDDAFRVFNVGVKALFETLDAAVTEYNTVVEEAEEFRDDIHSAMESFAEEHTEKWPQSARGQNHIEWMESWNVPFATMTIAEPEELELNEDYADRQPIPLDSLPDEPEGSAE